MLTLALATMLVKRPVVVGYVQNWNTSPTIDYAKLTHLNVAFENPTDDDGTMSFTPVDDTLVQAGHAAGVKVLVSIGGGGASGDKELTKRYFYLMSPARRAGFVRKLTEYVSAHGFDGLDVDIEGPSIAGDYGPFVIALGKALRASGKLMTSAVSVGYGGDQIPDDALKAFDLVNVMAYDATGSWDLSHPGQHSSMQFAKDNVAYWIKRGLPKSRLVLGVPFYGYGFGDAAKEKEWTYAKIIAAYPDADKADQIGSTIYYNGVPTIRAKAKYIVDQGLAGAMIWSVDQDVAGDRSLLAALDDVLRPKG